MARTSRDMAHSMVRQCGRRHEARTRWPTGTRSVANGREGAGRRMRRRAKHSSSRGRLKIRRPTPAGVGEVNHPSAGRFGAPTGERTPASRARRAAIATKHRAVATPREAMARRRRGHHLPSRPAHGVAANTASTSLSSQHAPSVPLPHTRLCVAQNSWTPDAPSPRPFPCPSPPARRHPKHEHSGTLVRTKLRGRPGRAARPRRRRVRGPMYRRTLRPCWPAATF